MRIEKYLVTKQIDISGQIRFVRMTIPNSHIPI